MEITAEKTEDELTGFERCAAGLADAVKSLKSRQSRDSAQTALELSSDVLSHGRQLLTQVSSMEVSYGELLLCPSADAFSRVPMCRRR